MMNISSAEMMKYAVFNNGNEIIGKSNDDSSS